jgi:hypothetical protein
MLSVLEDEVRRLAEVVLRLTHEVERLTREIDRRTHEIDRLTLADFWRVNGHDTLYEAMRLFNANHTRCKCTSCATADRVPDNERGQSHFQCSFQPAWEAYVRTHGLTYAFLPGTEQVDSHRYDADVHFVLWPCANWVNTGFGKKLWGCDNVAMLENYRMLLMHAGDRPKPLPVVAQVETECVICHTLLVGDAASAGCTHLFHIACLANWFLRSASCPTCRRGV